MPIDDRRLSMEYRLLQKYMDITPQPKPLSTESVTGMEKKRTCLNTSLENSASSQNAALRGGRWAEKMFFSTPFPSGQALPYSIPHPQDFSISFYPFMEINDPPGSDVPHRPPFSLLHVYLPELQKGPSSARTRRKADLFPQSCFGNGSERIMRSPSWTVQVLP